MVAVLTLQQTRANLFGTLLKQYLVQPPRYALMRVRGIITPGGGISLQEIAIERKSSGDTWCLVPSLQLTPEENGKALSGHLVALRSLSRRHSASLGARNGVKRRKAAPRKLPGFSIWANAPSNVCAKAVLQFRRA